MFGRWRVSNKFLFTCPPPSHPHEGHTLWKFTNNKTEWYHVDFNSSWYANVVFNVNIKNETAHHNKHSNSRLPPLLTQNRKLSQWSTLHLILLKCFKITHLLESQRRTNGSGPLKGLERTGADRLQTTDVKAKCEMPMRGVRRIHRNASVNGASATMGGTQSVLYKQ